ncbi:urease accessory protein UreF [Niallia sp.]|uniref:urease accessory protein UreF n=1 Tax=Niallia sp. TaxID=2837523 RepID=UPI00289D65C8|nr:urease accessory protein UreF [Niallia sp.]
MTNPLYPLLQLSDSNFPSGAFSHSFGLETYIQEGKITDKQSFYEAIIIYIKKQLVYVDGLALHLAYEAIAASSWDKVLEIDRLLYVSSLAEETRMGNKRIGERMAKLCQELYDSANLVQYISYIKEKDAFGHTSIVFAVLAHYLNVEEATALKTYLFTSISSLVQNAVRGIPLGQTDGQKILVAIQPLVDTCVDTIMSLTMEDFASVSPGLEIAQMKHERLHVRLFMS